MACWDQKGDDGFWFQLKRQQLERLESRIQQLQTALDVCTELRRTGSQSPSNMAASPQINLPSDPEEDEFYDCSEKEDTGSGIMLYRSQRFDRITPSTPR